MTKLITIIFISLGCLISVILLLVDRAIELNTALALCIGSVLVVALLHGVITEEFDGIDLSFSNLPALYGFVYGMYYVPALLIFCLNANASKNNIIEVSLLIYLGYIGWRTGLALSGCSKKTLCVPAFGRRDAASLLMLCWIGFSAVLIGYWYRISVGAFYTHGNVVEQDLTLTGSLLWNGTSQFELPGFMLLAMLASTGLVRKSATISLYIIASILFVIHLSAGEFNRLFIDSILVISVLQVSSGFRITWRRLVGGFCAFAVVLLFIQVTRVVSTVAGVGKGDLADSISLVEKGISASSGSAATIASANTLDRVSMPVAFLSTLIQRVNDGEPYIYGKVLLHQLSSVIPRAIWPDKPVYSSMQIDIKHEYGLPEIDDSSGSPISYYAFFGPMGVFVGSFLFGVLIGSLLRFVAKSNDPLMWLVLIWVYGAAIYIEIDQVINIVLALRYCIMAYTVFLLIRLFYPDKGYTLSSNTAN
jgi:hypothetical protein